MKGFNDRINSSVPSAETISITVGMWGLVHHKGNQNTGADSPHKALLWSKAASPSFTFKPSGLNKFKYPSGVNLRLI